MLTRDLIGIISSQGITEVLEAGDDFSGTGGNSGSVGDSNYNARWDYSSEIELASVAITGGKLRLSTERTPVTGQASEIVGNTQITHAGDFTMEMDGFSIITETGAGSDFGYWSEMVAKIGSVFYRVGWTHQIAPTAYGHVLKSNSTVIAEVPSVTAAASYKLVRVGNTLTGYYGASTIGSTTVSGDLANITLACITSDEGEFVVDIDAFSLVDGSSNPIPLP